MSNMPEDFDYTNIPDKRTEHTKPFPHKIAVIGLGGIGEGTLLKLRLQYPDAEIVGIAKDSTLAKKGHFQEAINEQEESESSLQNAKGSVRLTNNFAELNGCDYTLITGGPKRKAGEQRENLLARSKDFIDWVIDGIKTAKEANSDFNIDKTTWLFNTNPLDLLAQYFVEQTKEIGVDAKRICAPLGGELDISRLKRSICDRLNEYYKDTEGYKPITPKQIKNAKVEGEHGKNNMVVVTSNIEVNLNGDGQTWEKLTALEKDGKKVVDTEVNATLDAKKTALADPKNPRKQKMLDAIVEDTIEGGTIITLQTGSSDPQSSILINARTLKKLTDAKNAGKESEPFCSSILVDGKNGIFLSQEGTYQPDGTFKAVEKVKDKNAYNEQEQAEWDKAIAGQKARRGNLETDLKAAAANDIKAAAATKAAEAAKNKSLQTAYVNALRNQNAFAQWGEDKDAQEGRGRA